MAAADTLRLVFAPPHRAGMPFIIGGIVVCVIGLALAYWLAWLAGLFVLFCLYFFRDPERTAPGRPGLLLAPADGKVVSVAPAVPPLELGLTPGTRWRVGIFLSLFDVHVNRVPADGTVTRIAYRHGTFLNASFDRASDENERNAIAIRMLGGREVAVVQIAGLVARRILCDLREGDVVRAGNRFGLIRFGSRTDLYLPEGIRPLVAEGQTMIGGETVIADLTAS
ncbi:MAG: phosphatidylserine decarboxylase [Acetobacteraceae bacterium]|nr:phosphatidylserine decarboxylase [Acetobacteraceae bacterium]